MRTIETPPPADTNGEQHHAALTKIPPRASPTFVLLPPLHTATHPGGTWSLSRFFAIKFLSGPHLFIAWGATKCLE